jgi:hypothetical protein
MDNANYDPRMLLDIVSGGVFANDPFMLIDVGCGLGLDPAWRQFGPHLQAHAFDAQLVEIERLARDEKNAGVHYHAALVGLPDDDPIAARRREGRAEEAYFEPFARTSTAAALASARASGDVPFYETNNWAALELSTEKVGLAAFLTAQGVGSVDFVKTDTDGDDLDVLLSFEEMIEPAGALGFMVETPYTGSDSETVHTFHNVDRLLKRHGFLLCAISVNRYSRAALPAPFLYSILAQTVSGQPLWGDLVYLRDGVHPDHVRFGGLSPMKLLKLACLYELFLLPDCAAEILVTHRERLSSLVDVERLLDLLTPPLDGQTLSYREYLAAFEQDPTRFYPPRKEPAPPPPPAPPTLRQRARLVARTIHR